VQAVEAALGAHYLADGEELFGGFVSMLTHDALVGVQDRHHENWGVIVQREVVGPPPRFAPLYDSARGLFCNEPEERLGRFKGLAGDQRLHNYVERSRPLVGFDGLLPSKKRQFITHQELIGAVYRAYPRHRRRITNILEAYDWKRVRDELDDGVGDYFSGHRRTLVLICLRRRLLAIRRVLDGPRLD
ncbi:MAG: hypothetical protein ACRD1V_11795, partial [Vicinamibacterales bacterium]